MSIKVQRWEVISDTTDDLIITLDDVKSYLHIYEDSDDSLINSLIVMAHQKIGKHTNSFLFPTTIRAYYDFEYGYLTKNFSYQNSYYYDFYKRRLRLRFPQKHVNTDGLTVKYYRDDDTEQTIEDTMYIMDKTGAYTHLVFKDSFARPTFSRDYEAPLFIDYVSQYPRDALGERHRHAIRKVVYEAFDPYKRGDTSQMNYKQVSMNVDMLVRDIKEFNFG